MGASQIDKGSVLGKRILITVSILGAVLVIASIWSLSRALNNFFVETVDNSPPQGSIAPANEATTVNTVLSQEEIERQDMAEQRTAPVIQAPVATPPAIAPIPTNRQDDEVKLQKLKSTVNHKLVERMKQYIKDHPGQDNRKLEEQIKKRENQGT